MMRSIGSRATGPMPCGPRSSSMLKSRGHAAATRATPARIAELTLSSATTTAGYCSSASGISVSARANCAAASSRRPWASRRQPSSLCSWAVVGSAVAGRFPDGGRRFSAARRCLRFMHHLRGRISIHGKPGSRASARPLIEQHIAHPGILHVHVEGFLDPNLEAAPDRRTRQHGIAPAPHVLELAQVMPETLGAARPSDARDVGNRIAPGQELTVRQPSVHDPVDAIDLVHEAIDGIGKPLVRVVAEMARLPGLGPEIGHLPEQPLLDLNPVALVL